MFFGSKMSLAVCAMLLPLLISGVQAASVMSVDLGAEWIKVGIVSPGVPMEIVLNKESKRKTPAVIAFKDGIRTFGEDAVNVGVRFPKNTYKYFLDLLGKHFDHPVVKTFIKRYPHYTLKKSETTGRPIFVHDENTTFSPEELVAMLLGMCKENAETAAGQSVTEAVIIVPTFFTQAERRAVLEAASLAGLKVLQLITDYMAIAVNYGIFRTREINDTPAYAVFFDMGAYSTKAALVEFKLTKTKERGYVESVPTVRILGVAYDRQLGGAEITYRLREHLIKGWIEKGGKDPRSNPRAMEKLWKAADRLKIVLSANTEYYAQIESLMDDKDFRMKVSRPELEEICDDVWARAALVVSRAVRPALAEGEGALGVVAGGVTRTPRLLRNLKDMLGHEPSRGINADEAATMGAAYRAAALAKGYKVAPFIVKDSVMFPIQVVFTRNADGKIKKVKRTLFGAFNPYPQKKVITFNKHTEDFEFKTKYAEMDHIPESEIEQLGPLELATVTLEGVKEAIAKNTGDNIEHKGVKAHFGMDENGIISLVNVEYVAEKTVTEEKDSTLSKIGNTISKLFSSDEEGKTDEKGETNETDSAKNETEKTEQVNATETKEVQPTVITVKEPIKSKITFLVPPLSEEEIKKSKAKIEELDAIDKKRNERETALNNLEASVIDTQSKMDLDEFAECATPEEVKEIKELCSKISEWLYEDGSNSDTEVYQQKYNELLQKTEPIRYKHWEHKERPDAIVAIRNLLNSTTHFLKAAKNNTKEVNPDRDIFTEVEINMLETKLKDTETWLNKSIKEQDELKKNEPVKLTIDAIREKMGALDREVKYLLNKMKIWRPKKPAKTEKEAKTGDDDTESIKPVSEQADGGDTEQAKVEGVDGKVEGKAEEKVEAIEGTEDTHSEL